jgi:hypothetical protein
MTEYALSVSTPTANALIRDFEKLGCFRKLPGSNGDGLMRLIVTYDCLLVNEKPFSLT